MGQNRHFPAMPQNTKRQLVYYANYSLGYNRTSPNTANHPVCVGGSNIPKTNLTQRKVENIDKSPYVINGLTDTHVLVVLPFPVLRDHIPHTSPNCNQTGKFSKNTQEQFVCVTVYFIGIHYLLSTVTSLRCTHTVHVWKMLRNYTHDCSQVLRC